LPKDPVPPVMRIRFMRRNRGKSVVAGLIDRLGIG
jgi:hypothetical protein